MTANDITTDADRHEERRVGTARRGEPALLGLEASGEAASIYDAWFGPKSDNRLARSFRIQRE